MNDEWDRTFVFMEKDLRGRPYPYTRTTQKQKYVDPAWAKYTSSTQHIQWTVKAQMQANGWDKLPSGVPLAIKIVLFTGKGKGYHDRDSDNELKGIIDALQNIAYHNDCWIDDIQYTRAPTKDMLMLVVRIKVVSYDWLTCKALNLNLGEVCDIGLAHAMLDRIIEMEESHDP